ncbi:MAG: ABC transporter substrate-binding protein, partial [Bacteroidia bacterium]
AFSYAVDRDKIISDVLHTEAFGPGICGITPPGIPGYDITAITGYHFNPEKAKKLLAEAGYPDGKNIPHVTIELNSGGGKHLGVVEEVKKELKEVLNVDLDFVVVPFPQKFEDSKNAKAEMFRSGWVADFPDPENFLRNLYGAYVPDSLSVPSYPNTTRYKNPEFDKLLEEGFHAKNLEEGFRYFMKAEQLMMNDAPILILWYTENVKLAYSFVKNFYFNPMNYKDLSEVYLKQPVASEKP